MKIYEFAILPSGVGPGCPEFLKFGVGTLQQGNKLLKQLDQELAEWVGNPVADLEACFKFPKPYNKVPIKWAEGCDIMAWQDETKELLRDGTYYNDTEERYEVELISAGVVIEGRWVV